MIAIGCDHGGYELKKEIEAYLDSRGLESVSYTHLTLPTILRV